MQPHMDDQDFDDIMDITGCVELMDHDKFVVYEEDLHESQTVHKFVFEIDGVKGFEHVTHSVVPKNKVWEDVEAIHPDSDWLVDDSKLPKLTSSNPLEQRIARKHHKLMTGIRNLRIKTLLKLQLVYANMGRLSVGW